MARQPPQRIGQGELPGSPEGTSIRLKACNPTAGPIDPDGPGDTTYGGALVRGNKVGALAVRPDMAVSHTVQARAPQTLDQTVRKPLPALRLLFLVGSVLVILGGFQLFVFSERTDDFFAWTIAAPVTAAVDGAFFFTGFILLFSSSRAATWSDVRKVAYAVLVVATIKLVATLLDVDLFHFDDGGFLARFAAWAWLGVYIVIPTGLAVLIVMQLRLPGSDPVRGPGLPRLPAAAFVLISIVMLGIGAVQLFAADTAIDIWPWPLTPLTSHALSAWFIGVGVLAALTVYENDLPRSRHVMLGSTVLGVLLAAALARYGSDVDFGEPMAWVLGGLVATVIAAGGYGMLAARRAAAAREVSTAVT